MTEEMKTVKDDGRSAFPYQHVSSPNSELEYGMTLRQWYAGVALPAAIREAHDLNLHPDDVAREAVEYADAIIAELNK